MRAVEVPPQISGIYSDIGFHTPPGKCCIRYRGFTADYDYSSKFDDDAVHVFTFHDKMMSSSDAGGDAPGPLQSAQAFYTKAQRQHQQLLDRWTPFVLYRWLGTAGLLSVFMLRILLSQGWYIVCYAHAIYLLNLLLAFLQPKFDPSLQEDLLADEIEEGGEDVAPQLPSQRDDEFRPFVRRLPEWQFWLSSTRATVVATFCTLSEVFDVPVYWPILVVYFFVLFALTMRRQIQHMIKYKYIPFDIGRKARYGSNRH